MAGIREVSQGLTINIKPQAGTMGPIRYGPIWYTSLWRLFISYLAYYFRGHPRMH